MAGGLMQLVAYGAQDIYLTGNPKVTFFQARYQRHTNFAMECIEQTVNGSAGDNGRLSITVARNGDLVGEMFLTFSPIDGLGSISAPSTVLAIPAEPQSGTAALTLLTPSTDPVDNKIPGTQDVTDYAGFGTNSVDPSKYTNLGAALAPINPLLPRDGCWVAERAVADVELSIGGQRIDKHYQRWWRLYSELWMDSSKKALYGAMTSSGNPAGKTSGDVVTLPLFFFFNRNPGMYLPLIALQYHEVRLDVELASNFTKYFQASKGPKCWANYIYLDTEERRRFSQKGHEYLIEQVQHTGADSTGTSGAALGQKTIRLSYNHPVKELVWCHTMGSSQGTGLWDFTCGGGNVETSHAMCTNIGTTGATLTALATYEGAASGAPRVLRISGNLRVQSGMGGSSQFTDAFDKTTHAAAGSDKGFAGVWSSDDKNLAFEPMEVGKDVTDARTCNVASGPLTSFKLILNGQDRFKEQDGKYFNTVQPFYHHSGKPLPGIYSYSFALKPEDHQPTGTCNFSRIDNAQFQFSTRVHNTAPMTNKLIHMFAVNYNVLRIQSGMGGLAFSN